MNEKLVPTLISYSKGRHGQFAIEPLTCGYAEKLGNALRTALQRSLPVAGSGRSDSLAYHINYFVGATALDYNEKYERLALDFYTCCPLTPDEAMLAAAEMLDLHFEYARAPQSEVFRYVCLINEKGERDAYIEEFDFSVRCYSCLKRADIHTLSQLKEKTEEEIRAIRNLNTKCFDEIMAVLRETSAAQEGVEQARD